MATLNTLHRFHSSTAFGYAAATGLTTVTVLRALLLTMGAEECYRDRIYCSQFKSNHYHEQNPHRTPSASASETQWEAFTDMVRRRPLWLARIGTGDTQWHAMEYFTTLTLTKTLAMFEKTQAWMHARKLFDAAQDTGVSYEQAVDI
jgi:hypothetical protein